MPAEHAAVPSATVVAAIAADGEILVKVEGKGGTANRLLRLFLFKTKLLNCYIAKLLADGPSTSNPVTI